MMTCKYGLPYNRKLEHTATTERLVITSFTEYVETPLMCTRDTSPISRVHEINVCMSFSHGSLMKSDSTDLVTNYGVENAEFSVKFHKEAQMLRKWIDSSSWACASLHALRTSTYLCI